MGYNKDYNDIIAIEAAQMHAKIDEMMGGVDMR